MRITFLLNNSCRNENCKFGSGDDKYADFGGPHTNDNSRLIARNAFLSM